MTSRNLVKLCLHKTMFIYIYSFTVELKIISIMLTILHFFRKAEEGLISITGNTSPLKKKLRFHYGNSLGVVLFIFVYKDTMRAT